MNFSLRSASTLLHYAAIPALSLAICTFAPLRAQADDRAILAEDDASQSSYNDGWKTDSGGGSGFGNWTLRSASKQGAQSHAGFYTATKGQNPDLQGAAIRDKSFGLYANGEDYEIATAFRPLKKPLAVGQTFSFLLEHGRFEKKFENGDPTGGSIGITLRSGNSSSDCDDYNKHARFEFGCYQGKDTYQIYDGSNKQDTGVPVTSGGLSISLTLLTADTYEVEITTLADHKTVTLKDRRFGGDAGTKIESFCVFDRNSEKYDAYFNGFQIIGEDK